MKHKQVQLRQPVGMKLPKYEDETGRSKRDKEHCKNTKRLQVVEMREMHDVGEKECQRRSKLCIIEVLTEELVLGQVIAV